MVCLGLLSIYVTSHDGLVIELGEDVEGILLLGVHGC